MRLRMNHSERSRAGLALHLRNQHRSRSIDLRLLRRIARALLKDLAPASKVELGIHLVDRPEIVRLNETFLRHAGATDVISFDYSGEEENALGERKDKKDPRDERKAVHGEIFICVPEAVSQARRFGATWQAELVRYLVHGVLHLLEYDDLKPVARRQMRREENRLVRELAGRFAFQKLGTAKRKRKLADESRRMQPFQD